MAKKKKTKYCGTIMYKYPNVTARWTATPKYRQYNEKQGMDK